MDPIAALAAYLNQPAADRIERSLQVAIAHRLLTTPEALLPLVAERILSVVSLKSAA